jgi:hypothetical protein
VVFYPYTERPEVVVLCAYAFTGELVACDHDCVYLACDESLKVARGTQKLMLYDS